MLQPVMQQGNRAVHVPLSPVPTEVRGSEGQRVRGSEGQRVRGSEGPGAGSEDALSGAIVSAARGAWRRLSVTNGGRRARQQRGEKKERKRVKKSWEVPLGGEAVAAGPPRCLRRRYRRWMVTAGSEAPMRKLVGSDLGNRKLCCLSVGTEAEVKHDVAHRLAVKPLVGVLSVPLVSELFHIPKAAALNGETRERHLSLFAAWSGVRSLAARRLHFPRRGRRAASAETKGGSKEADILAHLGKRSPSSRQMKRGCMSFKPSGAT
ncbi:hypothetical protein EYF80_053530 [Liparis tanakae]|uniref:Uncharacterized protein n=1 Tax=Liparis tanakae TaxID=230148 RepID=A0A4Z2F5C4_9TELE|nr:hypothetical protein EYF80_053530 [Liparis tanakae]